MSRVHWWGPLGWNCLLVKPPKMEAHPSWKHSQDGSTAALPPGLTWNVEEDTLISWCLCKTDSIVELSVFQPSPYILAWHSDQQVSKMANFQTFQILSCLLSSFQAQTLCLIATPAFSEQIVWSKYAANNKDLRLPRSQATRHHCKTTSSRGAEFHFQMVWSKLSHNTYNKVSDPKLQIVASQR